MSDPSPQPCGRSRVPGKPGGDSQLKPRQTVGSPGRGEQEIGAKPAKTDRNSNYLALNWRCLAGDNRAEERGHRSQTIAKQASAGRADRPAAVADAPERHSSIIWINTHKCDERVTSRSHTLTARSPVSSRHARATLSSNVPICVFSG